MVFFYFRCIIAAKYSNMSQAYVFPGQGSQFPGMGKELYENNAEAEEFFEKANEILGFRISDIMFNGTAEELKQTKVTQPAIFLHSVITYSSKADYKPEAVAGHSLGEFSALVANKVLTFEDGLRLVSIRANAMQKACEARPGTMAAVLALPDEEVEQICQAVQEETGETVVPANYNCPGQLVISGTVKGIEVACERMKAAGAKRALILPVGGAFHSPLMAPAKEELEQAIAATTFSEAVCPICQNATAEAVTAVPAIRQNLIDQLTAPVRWTQSVQTMLAMEITTFIECGPGKVLQGLINKINRDAPGQKELRLEGIS